jgi:hypothetical protein
MSDRARRLTGLYATVAAIAAVALSPLLALSYLATAEGAEELEIGTVSAWAEPARDLTGGLLTWASPDRVYSTYVQTFALLFPAVLLCARALYARRSSTARTERWGWRIAYVGYALGSVGLVAASFALIPGDSDSDVLNLVFLALMLPGMLVSVVGSTVLGIALLGDGYRPRLTSWLLALSFPSMAVVPAVLGHNSLGMLPVMVAWGATGLQLSRASDRTRAHRPAPTAFEVGP